MEELNIKLNQLIKDIKDIKDMLPIKDINIYNVPYAPPMVMQTGWKCPSCGQWVFTNSAHYCLQGGNTSPCIAAPWTFYS